MKKLLLSLAVAAVTLLGPVLASAQEEGAKLNARVEGYNQPVKLEESSAALNWFALVLLAGICIAVLFKDAKRTHLD